MFCLGVSSILAQMIVAREVAILCLGNELILGVVLSVWLMLVGAGAGLERLIGKVVRESSRRSILAMLFLWLAIVVPLVILGLRGCAGVMRATGEYPSFAKVITVVFLAFSPICLPAGAMFTLGCDALASRIGTGGVSRVYASEALGSFVAGAAYSFILAGRAGALEVAWGGMTVCLVGAVLSLGSLRGWRIWACVSVGILCVAGISCVPRLEASSNAWRWASLGVTRDGRDGHPAVTLKQSEDTRYQNLTLVESAGLCSLFGDGQVIGSFPDAIDAERQVAFVMAQKPDARRVLLLGGNPAGEIPFLLKYPVKELVWVEQDPGVERFVRPAAPSLMAILDRDPRLRKVTDDGFRYVKQCRDRFDVILVHVPEPVTGGLNRYFTREFYEQVRRLLAQDGFMHTAVEGSELLEGEPAWMVGSVDRTLRAVFPVVKVTAGPPMSFFAAGRGGVLSFDRQELVRRISSSGVAFETFNPVYFLDADELAPGKIERAEQRLRAAGLGINTLMHPSSWLYTLIIWARYSNSVLSSWFLAARQLADYPLAGIMGVAGILVAGLVWIVSRLNSVRAARFAAWQAMAMTGFAGVALELVLLYAFQGFHGYVYVRMSFMIGLFMLGTVAGAMIVAWVEKGTLRQARSAVWGCLAVMGAVVVGLSGYLARGGESEAVLYGMMALVGTGVGAQFVAVGRWLALLGSDRTRAAGQVWMCDYWGSACGGLISGILLTVVLGIPATCLLLAVILAGSLLVVLATGR